MAAYFAISASNIILLLISPLKNRKRVFLHVSNICMRLYVSVLSFNCLQYFFKKLKNVINL